MAFTAQGLRSGTKPQFLSGLKAMLNFDMVGVMTTFASVVRRR